MFKKSTIRAAVASSVLIGSTTLASALTLASDGVDTFSALPGNFSLNTTGSLFSEYYDSATAEYGENIVADRFSPQNTKQSFRSIMVADSVLTFTYLGSEAKFGNALVSFNGGSGVTPVFSNFDLDLRSGSYEESVIGATETTTIRSLSQLDIAYCTDRNRDSDIKDAKEGCIFNSGAYKRDGQHLEIGVSGVFDHNGKKTVLLFFGDGVDRDDSDLDDMVIAISATPIPLPAGLMLLGSALAGLGIAGRRRKS